MMLALGIFVFCLWACIVLHKACKQIDEQDQSRQRLALLVAQELDRLQKQVDENRARIMEAEEEIFAVPQARWWGKN
ncbi:MAG: hypothetical protein EB078_08785 [Proteobacteria bacterium]|nr:hypothetical protein [Pseudomonadota bacterium]